MKIKNEKRLKNVELEKIKEKIKKKENRKILSETSNLRRKIS